MKLFLLITTPIVILLFTISTACSYMPKQTLSLSSRDAGKTVTLWINGDLTVTLESDVATGYRWSENAVISNGVFLQQTSHKYQPPAEAIPGRGGQEVWTFKALYTGTYPQPLNPFTTTVSMEYKRPFEPNNPPANTFNVTVKVKYPSK